MSDVGLYVPGYFSACMYVYRRNFEVVSLLVCVFVCLFPSLSTASYLVCLTLHLFYFSFSPRLPLLLVLLLFTFSRPSSAIPSIISSFFPHSPSLFLPSFLRLSLPSPLPPIQNIRKNGDDQPSFCIVSSHVWTEFGSFLIQEEVEYASIHIRTCQLCTLPCSPASEVFL